MYTYLIQYWKQTGLENVPIDVVCKRIMLSGRVSYVEAERVLQSSISTEIIFSTIFS